MALIELTFMMMELLLNTAGENIFTVKVKEVPAGKLKN